MYIFGMIFGCFFLLAIWGGIVSGIRMGFRGDIPKDMSEREVENYVKKLPPFDTKMPLPQTLNAAETRNALIRNNSDGIIYEEFKAFAKKRFAVTKDGLIYDGRVIPYRYVSFVSIYIPPSWFTCGVAQIMINDELKLLSFKYRDRERAKLAFNYINLVANSNLPWPPSLIYWENDLENLRKKEFEQNL